MSKQSTHHKSLNRRRFLQFSACATVGSVALPLFAQSGSDRTLEVFKEVTCGCCVFWVEHMEENGYTTNIHHPADLNQVKDQLGVIPAWQSCHTAVSKDGFLFEGHVPARYVSQFLAAPSENALGLAVPGMPLGSPGMEMGGRFTPYDVLLMKKDGSAEVFVSIKSASDQ